MCNITKQIKYSRFLDQDWPKVLKGVSRRPPLHTGCSLTGMNLNKPFLHKMLKRFEQGVRTAMHTVVTYVLIPKFWYTYPPHVSL